jgi:hypothetical protein
LKQGGVEHQDEHRDLYWFGPPEHNILCPVWVNIYSINLGELDRRVRNGGIISLGVLREVLLVVSVLVGKRASLCGLSRLL